MRLAATCIALLASMLTIPAVLGQKISGGLSERQISVDSSFAGETLTLFGNVEPEAGATQKYVEGPFDVIVVVTGPAIDRVARRKTNKYGIWINTEDVFFSGFPSFKWVLASDHLADIAEPDVLRANKIPLDSLGEFVTTKGNGNPALFAKELERLMVDERLFGVDELGVVFQSATLYSARVSLPADVPNGSFLAETFLFKNGEVVARKAEGFQVRKTGFERFVGDASRNSPALYGLICVCLAVFTGWLGGVAFRR